MFSIIFLEKREGVGVGIMLKRSLDAEIYHTGTSYTSFEAIGVHLKVLSRDIYILVIYRPPSSSGINSMNTFMEEFSSCLEHYVIKPGSLMIAGDFNLHIDRPSDVSTFLVFLKHLIYDNMLLKPLIALAIF